MKRTWIFASAAFFLTAIALSAAPGAAPLPSEVLAAILGEPMAGGSCAPQAGGLPFAAQPPRPIQMSACTATATCESGTVGCSGNSSCSAVDRNCDFGERGKVTCDGVTTQCPTNCPCDDTPVCCRCERLGDCMSCCKCGGGTIMQCSEECNP